MNTRRADSIESSTQGTARLIGSLLATAGLVNAGYLSWLHLSDRTALLCTEGGGCDLVQNSVYSQIGGVPIALIGLAGYAFILLGLAFEERLAEWGPPLVLGASLIGTLYSAYLTYLELFVLHAICPYCVASAAFMVGLLIIAISRFRQTWREAD